jgi:hypothetical protein
MKVTIDIDDDLMRRARRLTGLRTKREVVQRALQTLVQLKEQERIRRYRGKLPSSRCHPNCAELAGDLIGSFRGGPPDLSTNKRYLEEAILADHFKHAARSMIKRTVKDYRTTLRKLAKAPRAKEG